MQSAAGDWPNAKLIGSNLTAVERSEFGFGLGLGLPHPATDRCDRNSAGARRRDLGGLVWSESTLRRLALEAVLEP